MLKKTMMGLLVMVGLGACGTSHSVSKSTVFEPIPGQVRAQPQMVSRQAVNEIGAEDRAEQPLFKVVDYEIKVPQDLTVSEANLFYPVADIVWRGDPPGNRKAQVGAIFHDSLKRALPHVQGPRPVRVEIVVSRFHSVTEKTRYTVGGLHSIGFSIMVQDHQTGRTIVPLRHIRTDLEAFGGKRAVTAEREGHTMKARIEAHLVNVLAQQLLSPDGNGPFVVAEAN